jgi:uncharacterized membrane protein (DUF373 family)
VFDALLAKFQKIVIIVLIALLFVVIVLSTGDLGVRIAEAVWKVPRFLIPVQGLLEIFGLFLLVLIGVEILETLRAYLKKDVIQICVVLEVALIAMARKVIILEPAGLTGVAIFGVAALILALAMAYYVVRTKEE